MGKMNQMAVRREFEQDRLRAKQEGQSFGLSGHPDIANPWPLNTELGRAWQLGWEQGNHERLAQVA